MDFEKAYAWAKEHDTTGGYVSALLDEIDRLQPIAQAAQDYVMAGLCGNVDIRVQWAKLVEVARTDR